MAKQHGIQL